MRGPGNKSAPGIQASPGYDCAAELAGIIPVLRA